MKLSSVGGPERRARQGAAGRLRTSYQGSTAGQEAAAGKVEPSEARVGSYEVGERLRALPQAKGLLQGEWRRTLPRIWF